MNKLYLKITLLFVVFLLIGLFINFKIYQEHEKELYYVNNKIIANILDKHPELQDEIISLMTTDIDVSNVLNKYGIDEYSDINYLRENNQYKQKIIYYNLGYLLILILTIYLLITYHNYKFNKKITRINKYMNKVLNGDYSIDIRDYQENKLSLLKNDIYKLVVRLKEQSDREQEDKIYLKDFLSDISHQLKTPLTSMYVINDILEKEKDENKRKEFLHKNKIQLERIEWLISSLLKMSLLDSGTTKLVKTDVNIKDLINKSLEPINIRLDLKNITINMTGDSNIYYKLDFNWMVEALLNILKNSYEYTQEGGNINVFYEINPLYLMIKISDSGIGIKKSEINNIFKRFYKVNKNSEGVGIGLNMAKKIIEMHDGQITVKSTPQTGTTFEIKFYKQVV